MGQASFPEIYERWLVGPLFKPWAEMTFDRLALSPGDRVLDIACGTGIVARVARERLGDAGYVLGVDVNPDMLAVARSAAPSIDWREGNASALPLRDGEQFDVVVCQQGLQFFPDKAAAAGEMRRALATAVESPWLPGAPMRKSHFSGSYAVSPSAIWAR
jgi:ubiquinone/menaquinone biosynthesis C-methylase UbiE